ncbi:MAG: amidohydrolase family protein [Bacteroidetes bacterium]|nr:amidohydrolase family protein [Bacteroidota bacterium]
MRKISADYIFSVSSPPIKNGVVIVDDKGIILDVTSQQLEVTEVHAGIIAPGFVNTHCHLELSHLKGQVAQHKGLTGFVSELVPKRGTFSPEQIKSAIESAEDEMIRNGIVAVGDISNTDHSFEQKKKRKIAYHTFLEIFDLAPEKAEEKISEAKSLLLKFKSSNSSITPHAPYSVSGKLLERIDSLKQPFLSIHNQEAASENELFLSGTGPLAELMQKAGVDIDSKRRSKNSLLFVLGALIETKKILLVHNTYTSKEDIEIIKHYSQGGECEVMLCLCPKANLYIENKLPDISMFLEQGMKMTIGTDSLASNDSLSVLDELKTISKHFQKIHFESLITWATKNGAEFIGMDKEYGTIEKGKKPGLNLLKGMNEKFELSEKVSVQKLI